MIAVDTNIIVRLLTRDDEAQFERALICFSFDDVLVTETVLLETEWVLRHAYGFDAVDINAAILKLAGLPNVALSDELRILTALDWHDKGLDFADALHLAGCQAVRQMMTFDKAFIKGSTGLGRIEVTLPPTK